jgi:ubiquinone/menaquinone biosynthesis C-methylase UbiE
MKSYREKDKEIYYKQITKLATKKEIIILELGCTDNSTIKNINKYFPKAKFYGTEWDGWKGKFEKPKELEKLYFLDLNKDKLPFKENTVDIVICNQVLEHLYEIDKVLDDVYRVLKTNGKFIACIPNLAALHERISLLFGYNPSTWHTSKKQIGLRNGAYTDNRTHCNGFTVKGFRNLIKQHNFKPVSYITSEVYIKENAYIPFMSKIFKDFALSQAWILKK